MTTQKKKQYGVWLDNQHEIVVGYPDLEGSSFAILGHVVHDSVPKNSSENAGNNHEIALTRKFFKDIAAIMPNVDEMHVTGTGQVQEQFIRFLAETPQYRNAVTSESTSNKMSDEALITFISSHLGAK